MRRKLITGLVSAALFAGCKPITMPPVLSRDECVVAASADAASHSFETAQFHKDTELLRHFLSPDYVFVHASGAVGDRNDFVGGFENKDELFTTFDISHRRVMNAGAGGAVVVAEAVVIGVKLGLKFRQHFRYADVYAVTDHRWCVVYTQVTRLPD